MLDLILFSQLTDECKFGAPRPPEVVKEILLDPLKLLQVFNIDVAQQFLLLHLLIENLRRQNVLFVEVRIALLSFGLSDHNHLLSLLDLVHLLNFAEVGHGME